MANFQPSQDQTVPTTRLEHQPIVTGIRIREPGPHSRLPTRAVLIGTWRPSPKENRQPYAVWASIDNTKRVNRRIVAEDTAGFALKGQRRCAARHSDIDYLPEFKGLSDNEVKAKVFSLLGESPPAGLATLPNDVADIAPAVNQQDPIKINVLQHTTPQTLQRQPQEEDERVPHSYHRKSEEPLHCPSCPDRKDRKECGGIGDGWIGNWLNPLLIQAHQCQSYSDLQWTPIHCQKCPTQLHGRDCDGVSQWVLIGWITSTLGSVTRK